MAAGIVASSVLFFTDLQIEPGRSLGLLLMTLLLAFVMVSNFRYRSFKDVDFKRRLPFPYLVLGVALLVVVAIRPEIMLFALFMSYALLGAIFGILRLGRPAPQIASHGHAPESGDDLHEVIEDEDHQS